MRSVLIHRIGRLAAAPAGAAAASASTTYLGRGGSANATAAAASSAVAARCSSSAAAAASSSSDGLALLLRLAPRPRLMSSSSAAGGGAKAAAEKAAAAPPRPPSSGAAAAKGGGGGGFVAWYESHLHARPVPTKMVTGCLLWGLGDVVAQVVPVVTHPHKEGAARPFVFDYARLGRASAFGFALHAPIAHLHYNFLEWMTVRAGITGLKIPLFKAFMEQFVYWSWFSNSLYHGAMGAMQGMNGQQIYDRIADVLWDTQKAQWAFWIPVQLVNFRYVPVRHQLNVVLLTSIVWTALLSAWYPPKEDRDEKEKSGLEPERIASV